MWNFKYNAFSHTYLLTHLVNLEVSCIFFTFSAPPDNLSIQEFQKNESIDVEVRRLQQMYNTVKHTRQWHSQVAFSFERIFGKAARSLFFWDVFFFHLKRRQIQRLKIWQLQGFAKDRKLHAKNLSTWVQTGIKGNKGNVFLLLIHYLILTYYVIAKQLHR